MAKGRKTGGRDIKEGQVLNPNGRPVVPPDLKKAREMNKDEFERIANKFLYMNQDEIKYQMAYGELSMIELAVCQLIVIGVNKGDPWRLGFLLDRLLGKPKDFGLVDKVIIDRNQDNSGKKVIQVTFTQKPQES